MNERERSDSILRGTVASVGPPSISWWRHASRARDARARPGRPRDQEMTVFTSRSRKTDDAVYFGVRRDAGRSRSRCRCRARPKIALASSCSLCARTTPKAARCATRTWSALQRIPGGQEAAQRMAWKSATSWATRHTARRANSSRPRAHRGRRRLRSALPLVGLMV